MELLHPVVERQESTAADFRVLQSLQPLQYVQAHLGDERSRSQIHMDGAWLANPSKIRDGSWKGCKKDKEERSK
jgi:hypothetical protein